MTKKILPLIAVLLVAASLQAQDPSPYRVLMHRSELPSSLTAAPDLAPTLTVPAETEADVQLLSGIHTRISNVDDPIRAMLVRPVLVDGRVALPLGTLLDGHITQVRAARRLHRAGELSLRFDQVTLPGGETEPLSAVLARLESPTPSKPRLDAEGHLRGARGFSWKGITGSFAAFSAFAGVKYAVAGAGALTSFLPATGSALLGYELFWPRGNDVHLPPDTLCRVRLNYPLTVRVAW
jgi:hypothetical protein